MRWRCRRSAVQTLNADLSTLKEKFADQIDADISLDDYIDSDIEVTTSHGILTNAEIIAEVTGTQEDDDLNEQNDDIEDEDLITKPGAEKVLKAISALEDFSLYSTFGEAMMRSLNGL